MEGSSYNNYPGNWGLSEELGQDNGVFSHNPVPFEYTPSASLFANTFPTDSFLYDNCLQDSVLDPTTPHPSIHRYPHCVHYDTIQQASAIRKDAAAGLAGDIAGYEASSSSPQASPTSVEDLYSPRNTCNSSVKGKRSNRRGKGKYHDRPTPLECGWNNCKRPRPFKNKGTLMRHIETQHVDPYSVECPDDKCDQVFSRKDNMQEHLHRVHYYRS